VKTIIPPGVCLPPNPRLPAGTGARPFALCPGITLRVPVVQATLGRCDGPRLAAEVSAAGALGTMTIRDPEDATHRRNLDRIRRRTLRPVLLAFTAEWEPDAVLNTALEMGFRHFSVFWWNAPRLIRRIHDAGGTVFYQVGTEEQAMEALDAGANVLVAQGTDAGGQVRSPHPVTELISLLRGLPDGARVPIVAGGGLADCGDVARVLAAGASAALLGTRFLLSDESLAPAQDKRRLRAARFADLTLDRRMIGDWPCAPRRRLALRSGDDRPSLFAGSGLDAIQDILPARDIVRLLRPR
jgi:nitronate monooxygenase